ncbi:MAG: Rrf2 family transcriptional regulator [Spirochaetia bacterium]|nr:Rrf2 family transcriptional regulator [Spirochaetia bacterium]
MRMTTKGRYALRASLALAKLCDGVKPVSIKTISEYEDISPEFLEQIFFRLRKSGLISSVRGPGGGFLFAKPLDEILLKDIVDASGEGIKLSACSGSPHESCTREADCIASDVWRELSQYIDAYLVSMSLNDILNRKPAKTRT